MAWSWFTPRGGTAEYVRALTADAQIMSGSTPDQDGNASIRPDDRVRRLYRSPEEWQREIWDYLDTLGEFAQGVQWKANMLSRVRLVPARRPPTPDADPEPITTGPAADIMAELAGGLGGQAGLMSAFATYLSAPGECWLVGEQADGRNRWYTRSIEELMPAQTGDNRYKISEGNGRWRNLPDESMVVRVWRPHRRYHNVATSPARACRVLLRELELINRHIQAQFLSRLASAGVLVLPDEITFPVRPEFADEPDPFVSEWVEIAAEAIHTPGSAAAIVPIPIRVPAEYVDKVRHIDFTLKLDEQIIQKRDSCLARLAISLDMPPEALLGTRDVNHWSAWLIDEQGVKIHVAPDVEIICHALTEGYLVPRMAAAGEPVDDLIVWYDASDLILRPDRSKSATDAFDRVELSGEAYRRENGFDETDRPDDTERKRILLTAMVRTQAVNAPTAIGELFPELDDMAPQPVDAPRPPNENEPASPGGARENPRTPPAAEPPERAAAEAKEEALVADLTMQAGLEHAIRVTLGGEWSLLHPRDCINHLFACPVTHATWARPVAALPGTSGVYRCWLNPHGQPVLGVRVRDAEVAGWIESTHNRDGVPRLVSMPGGT